VAKLISDSCSDHFLSLLFFDRTPRCRYIDCQSLVKISEILVGANILSTPMYCDFLAWRASTTRPGCDSWIARPGSAPDAAICCSPGQAPGPGPKRPSSDDRALGANILSTPMFCDFLAWRAGTTRPGQYGRKSTHISWPASYSPPLSYYTRRGHHLQKRAPARTERSQPLWTLPGQNSKEMLHWTYIFLHVPIFCRCLYFVAA
jgi:hypothetical protein